MSLFRRLCEIDVLKRAWHLARNDARTDFMFDPYAYTEYGFDLDDYIASLSDRLASGTFHPKPLQTIDVPKSTLSVRPGSVLTVEDKIVLFGIAYLIAPPLDKKLPDNVYSYRFRKNAKRELFKDNELLEFSFLKRKTIRKRIEILEPWYGVWPSSCKKHKWCLR